MFTFQPVIPDLDNNIKHSIQPLIPDNRSLWGILATTFALAEGRQYDHPR
jgi:hypothetical protein